ncbi:MAG: nucleotidyltransferase domain-containing protein [Spirochaetia bacterium]
MLKGGPLTLDLISDRLRPSLQEAGVEKAIVFGSYARGTQDARSDVDLILIMHTEERYLKRFDRIMGVYRALPEASVEVFIYTPEEFERNADRTFFKRALSEGKVIYER